MKGYRTRAWRGMGAGLAAGVCIFCAVGWAYDPPEIIGVLTSPQESSVGFGSDFCWIGDQNGDGFHDLLISQNRGDTISRAYIYHGGERVANEPSFTFTPYEAELSTGENVSYLGHLRGRDRPPTVALYSLNYDIGSRVDLYEITRDMSNNSRETLLSGEWERQFPILSGGYRNRPTDFNGDGFGDLIVMNARVGFQVHFGSDQLDTIADWSRYMHVLDWSSGYDINGDGYDDILIFTRENDVEWFSLYLGGADPDTLPAVRVRAADYNLTDSFAMLPDINGDGYDEWGVFWTRFETDDGFRIFLGSEEPDGVPDLDMEGARAWVGLGDGDLTGGDFNGDGFGDVAVRIRTGPDEGEESALMLHFGNRWIGNIEGEKRSDLFVDMLEYYQEYREDFIYNFTLGAVGDYNGDGVDDFIGAVHKKVFIFAGSRGWRVDAPPETNPPQSYILTLEAHPNPFNSQLRVEFGLPVGGFTTLELIDLTGRKAATWIEGEISPGLHRRSFAADGIPAGVYMLKMTVGGQVQARKVVLLK